MDGAGRHVVHHVCLQSRGGATAVARTLHNGLEGLRYRCTMAHEVQEEEIGLCVEPSRAGGCLEPGSVLHVHSTRDWLSLLAGVAPGTPLVITAHDCSLVTGGCPYPLDCPGFARGCPDPCPRGFPESAWVRRDKLSLLEVLNPLMASPSGWLARILRAGLPGLVVTVVPNGVDWPDAPFSRAAGRAALGLDRETPLALFLAHGGEKAAYKSGDRWAPIWERVAGKCPGAVGIFAGGDQADLSGSVLRLPYLGGDRLRSLFGAADLFAHPTLADNHPLVVLQAMAEETPAVSYAVGGIPEQVVDGVTGVLVPAGDEEAFAEKTAALLQNRAGAREMGRAAREHGAARFTADRMVKDYDVLYKGLGPIRPQPAESGI